MDVTVGPDGTVFLVGDGLRAYIYDGASFTNTAHINVGNSFEPAYGVAVDSNGTVFLIRRSYPMGGDGPGLLAYIYDGASLSNTAHDDRGYGRDVAVDRDGTIFVATEWASLRAYIFDDSSFKNTASTDDIDYEKGTRSFGGLAVGPDRTIFLANGSDGLWAYIFDDTSFTNTAHINDGVDDAQGVAVGPDGTVFLANGEDGLRAYRYDGTSFINTAHINDGGDATDVTVVSDGIVFLANGDDGLRAYEYDGASFTNTAHINDGDRARGVALGPDGTIFLAAGHEGLIAYTYSDYTGITDELSIIPVKYELLQNYPNPFNPSTNIEFSIPKSQFVTLIIYNLLGQEVITLVSDKLDAGSYTYSWDAGQLASGIYLYKLQAGSFQKILKLVLIK
jgi:hypothetical protein